MKKLNLKEAYADEYISNDLRLILIDKLKNALKEELNAWYGYIIVKEWLVGSSRPNVVKMYEDTAKDELEDHGYWLMKRINELGGTIEDITSSPASWLTADHTYASPKWSNKYNGKIVSNNDNDKVISIQESLFTNIENELGAIETYKELIEIAQSAKDYTTESKCKQILADEEEHLQLLQEFLDDMVERKQKELN